MKIESTIFVVICILSCAIANSTKSLLNTTLIQNIFNKHSTNITIHTFEHLLKEIDTIEPINDENYKPIKKCLHAKTSRVKEFLRTTNDELVFKNMSSVFFNYIQECLRDNLTYSNDKNITADKSENWLFAFGSAIIITIIGLLCYLVVPSFNSCCFNYFFQFLVALAVGSLCGDALLHLIPHAFSNHNHSNEEQSSEHENNHGSEDHNAGVYKGLAALLGIYVFFLIEKIMHMRRARKEKRHRQTELAISESEHELIRNVIINTTTNSSNVNLNQMPKIDEHESNAKLDNMITQNGGLTELRVNSITGSNKVYTNEQQKQLQQIDLIEDQSCLVIHANKDLKYISQYLPNNKCTENVDHHDHENEIEHLHQHSQASRLGQLNTKNSKNKLLAEQSTLLMLNEPTINTNENDDNQSKKQHGHSHSHKYKTPREKAHHDHHKKHEKEINDIKLIAWMVLMGDGLHNFSDGLAIGASFASSLSIGFGTSIAVLCHELPHEIGDFAVLRRAGVSLKRALVFNLVSGVLCLLGVLVGLLIGGIDTLSSWAFLFIAGTFLYISLVDMIPELSEDKDDDSVFNFLIQSFGILVGIGIMLMIALFEEKIVKMFSRI